MSGVWVVIEGPDGSGKSTLARDLAGLLSYEHGPAVLQSLRQHSAEIEYTLPLQWNLLGLHVVQDRSLLSRIAYQPIVLVPGAEPKDLDEARDRMVSVSRRCAVLHLTADEGVLAERVAAAGDEYFDPLMSGALAKSYWKTMAWWEGAGGWVRTFDTTERFPTALEALLAVSAAPSVRLGGSRSSMIS